MASLNHHTPVVTTPSPPLWLGLVVGNTRLHWLACRGNTALAQWHTRHLASGDRDRLLSSGFAPTQWLPLLEGPEPPPPSPLGHPPLYGLSVVPTQADLWQGYPGWRLLTLGDIPLGQTYPSLGCDRALNLWAAGEGYGWPLVVIDGGTALTLTAGVAGNLLGGVILPGVRLWVQALGQGTAQLPQGLALDGLPQTLAQRWPRDTPGAIASGLAHGLRATLQDYLQAWQATYPQGQVVVTGGDGPLLCGLLGAVAHGAGQPLRIPGLALPVHLCPTLPWDGLRALVGSGLCQ